MADEKGFDRSIYPELEVYWEKFEETVKPYIHIETKIDNNMSLWQSKFGGFPYWPKDIEYPAGKDGEPMYLVAQINFNEIPPLEQFPKTGILQWFITGDGLYGLAGYKFTDMVIQYGWKIVYFKEIEKFKKNILTNFSFLPKPKELDPWPPVINGCSLQFKKEYAPVACSDYQFKTNFGNPFDFFDSIDTSLIDSYNTDYPASGHKIGGYADFAQVDPREPEWGYNTLLLQIDCEPSKGIDFGSAGVGHLFIKEQDLKKLDFTKVMYHWDCG